MPKSTESKRRCSSYFKPGLLEGRPSVIWFRVAVQETEPGSGSATPCWLRTNAEGPFAASSGADKDICTDIQPPGRSPGCASSPEPWKEEARSHRTSNQWVRAPPNRSTGGTASAAATAGRGSERQTKHDTQIARNRLGHSTGFTRGDARDPPPTCASSDCKRGGRATHQAARAQAAARRAAAGVLSAPRCRC